MRLVKLVVLVVVVLLVVLVVVLVVVLLLEAPVRLAQVQQPRVDSLRGLLPRVPPD